MTAVCWDVDVFIFHAQLTFRILSSEHRPGNVRISVRVSMSPICLVGPSVKRRFVGGSLSGCWIWHSEVMSAGRPLSEVMELIPVVVIARPHSGRHPSAVSGTPPFTSPVHSPVHISDCLQLFLCFQQFFAELSDALLQTTGVLLFFRQRNPQLLSFFLKLLVLQFDVFLRINIKRT